MRSIGSATRFASYVSRLQGIGNSTLCGNREPLAIHANQQLQTLPRRIAHGLVRMSRTSTNIAGRVATPEASWRHTEPIVPRLPRPISKNPLWKYPVRKGCHPGAKPLEGDGRAKPEPSMSFCISFDTCFCIPSNSSKRRVA